VSNINGWNAQANEGVLVKVGAYDAGTRKLQMLDARLTQFARGRQRATCGDGVMAAPLGEACDDGNAVAGDGCSADCQEEATHSCTNPACGTSTCSLLAIDDDRCGTRGSGFGLGEGFGGWILGLRARGR
jgi:cysteine-rich repeat protein